MIRTILITTTLLMTVTTAIASDNPFFTEWNTPFGVPPFQQIKLEHYAPAFEEGMQQQKQEVAAIVENPAAPTFANTLEALDRSGHLLDKVSLVFFAMKSSMTNDDLEAVAKQIVPELSKHSDAILLNDALFRRIEAVYAQRDKLNLTGEQLRLLEEDYKNFVRGGAKLPPDKKARLTEINAELSLLSLSFGEHVLKENNRFELVLDKEADLAGLPADVVAAATETAKQRGHEGKWVFTLHKPSLIPFLQYSKRRDLREKIYKGYIERGNHDDELDNKKICARMAALRVEKAKLLGYQTHAHFVLEDNMAKEPEQVYELLRKLWTPALARAKTEAADMQKMIDAEGGGFKIQEWDWCYYSERF